MTGKAPELLDADTVDRVIDSLTMGDVQAAFEEGVPDKAIGGVAFRRAAKRLGVVSNGADALDMVPASLVRHVGERMQAALSDQNPKSASTGD